VITIVAHFHATLSRHYLLNYRTCSM